MKLQRLEPPAWKSAFQWCESWNRWGWLRAHSCNHPGLLVTAEWALPIRQNKPGACFGSFSGAALIVHRGFHPTSSNTGLNIYILQQGPAVSGLVLICVGEAPVQCNASARCQNVMEKALLIITWCSGGLRPACHYPVIKNECVLIELSCIQDRPDLIDDQLSSASGWDQTGVAT